MSTTNGPWPKLAGTSHGTGTCTGDHAAGLCSGWKLAAPKADPLAAANRTIDLLNEYGQAKFGDEWWPGNARNWIGDGRELEYLLDPGSAALADREDPDLADEEEAS